MSPDRTNAERQARHRAKQAAEIAALKAELLALRNASGQVKAGADVARLEAEIATLRRYIAEAEQQRDTALAEQASMRKMLDDGRHVIAEAKAILAAKAIFPPDVGKTVLHSTHPDRVTDPRWKVRYEKAFQFIKDHERALIQKPPPPRPVGLPRTVEELMAAKWRATEERKAKRAAKRAAKANPPKRLHLSTD